MRPTAAGWAPGCGWWPCLIALIHRFLSGPPSAVPVQAFPLWRCCLLFCAGHLRESGWALWRVRWRAAGQLRFAHLPACWRWHQPRSWRQADKPVQRGPSGVPNYWSGMLLDGLLLFSDGGGPEIIASAALPGLHVSANLLVAVAAWRCRRSPAAAICWACPCEPEGSVQGQLSAAPSLSRPGLP